MLRILFKSLPITSRFVHAAFSSTHVTMQTSYADYVKFMELVGNVKVSENFLLL